MGSRLQDDLDAAVLLVAKSLVQFGALFQRRTMCDDERRINFAFLNTLQQLRQIMLDRRLCHAKGEAAIDRRTHRNFVEEAAIDADNRYRAEVTATVDGLPEYMGPIGAHE